MYKYKYNGPVMNFGKCIANNWTSETSAVSAKKAMNNFKYQYVIQNGFNAGGFKIELDPRKITLI